MSHHGFRWSTDHVPANCVHCEVPGPIGTCKLDFSKFNNKFQIYNKDLFKFKSKKKFDFVVSNGVAHHTHDIKKNIEIAINFLKKGGTFNKTNVEDIHFDNEKPTFITNNQKFSFEWSLFSIIEFKK